MLKKMENFFKILFGKEKLNIKENKPIDIFLNELNIENNNKSKLQSKEVKEYLDILISERKYKILQSLLDIGAILSNQQFLTISKDFAFFMNYGGSEEKVFQNFSKEEHSKISSENFKSFFNEDIIALTEIIFYKEYLDLVKHDFFIETIKPQNVENPLFNNGFSYFICKNCTMKPQVIFNENPELFELITNMFLIEFGQKEKKLKTYFSLDIFINLWHHSLDTSGFKRSEHLQQYLNNKLEKWGYADFKINIKNSHGYEDEKSKKIIQEFLHTINPSDYALSDSFLKDFFKNYPLYRFGTKTAVNIDSINIVSSEIDSAVQTSFNNFVQICSFLKNSNIDSFHEKMLKKIEEEKNNIQKSTIELKTYDENKNTWDLPDIILNTVNNHILILKSIRNSSDDPELISYSENTFLEIQQALIDLEQLNSIEKINTEDTLKNLEPIFSNIQSHFKKNNDLLLNSLEKNSKITRKHLNY